MTVYDRLQKILRVGIEFCQDQWFDKTRRVRTSGNVMLGTAGIAPDDVRDSELYVPARPAHIREALSEMPIRDVSRYSYVDLGSGKGRSLFVAAELPFRKIFGVEFSPFLHEEACANVRRFRFWKTQCLDIELIHKNALDFDFPGDELVLYFFNPFGAVTMQQVMNQLQQSLKSNPRHVVIVLLWPRCGDQVLQVEGMQLVRSTKRHQILEVHSPAT